VLSHRGTIAKQKKKRHKMDNYLQNFVAQCPNCRKAFRELELEYRDNMRAMQQTIRDQDAKITKLMSQQVQPPASDQEKDDIENQTYKNSRPPDHNPDRTQYPSSSNPKKCTFPLIDSNFDRPYIQKERLEEFTNKHEGWKKDTPSSSAVDNNPPSSSTIDSYGWSRKTAHMETPTFDFDELDPTLLSGCVNDWNDPSEIKSVSKYRADISFYVLNTCGPIHHKFRKNQIIVSKFAMCVSWTGEIDDDQGRKINQALEDAFKEVNAIGLNPSHPMAPNNKDNARIWLIINSGGGELEPTYSVIQKMQEIKHRGTKIYTIVDDKAHSAAGLISSSGDHRYIKKNSSMLIHLPWYPNTRYLNLIDQFRSDVGAFTEINSVTNGRIFERLKQFYNLFVQLIQNNQVRFDHSNWKYKQILMNNKVIKDQNDAIKIGKFLMANDGKGRLLSSEEAVKHRYCDAKIDNVDITNRKFEFIYL